MTRKQLKINDHYISYLDNEKEGQPLICLHGHFGTGSMFLFMQQIHNSRLILVDQRGHGYSSHTKTYERDDYINDLDEIIRFEKIINPIILGHSLGGVNTYQYAARHKSVKAIIVEDIGTVVNCSNEFIKNIPDSFQSFFDVEQAFQKINMIYGPYFLESIRNDGLQWKFQFDYEGMVISQEKMNGIYWNEWAQLECPVLLMHGLNSWACTTENIIEMEKRNSHVKLITFPEVGHTIHDECREKFCMDVQEFLKSFVN